MSLGAASSCWNSFLSCWHGVNAYGMSPGPCREAAVLKVKLLASPGILEF